MSGAPNSNKKAVHVKWAGKTIALGTFPVEEAEEKCARAKTLTRAWRSTMRPKPTREWVMQELERLQVRVVTGRVGRTGDDFDDALGEAPSTYNYDETDNLSMIHSLPTGQDQSAQLSRNQRKSSHLMRRGSITETLLSVAGAERNLSLGYGGSNSAQPQRGAGGFRDSMGWASIIGGHDPTMDPFWQNQGYQHPHRNSSMNLARNLLMQDSSMGGYDPRGSFVGGGGGYDPYLATQQRNNSFLGAGPGFGGGGVNNPNSNAGDLNNSNFLPSNSNAGNVSSVANDAKPSSSAAGDKKDSTQSPPIAPPHRPLVGGGSAAAYEAAREEHYRELAERKKKESVVSGAINNPVVSSTSAANEGVMNPNNSHQGNNLSGLSASARQHYEMLKLHHMNLLNEIRETSMMINLYEQQQQQQVPGTFNDFPPAQGAMGGAGIDPMEQLLTQKRMNTEQNLQQYETLRRLSDVSLTLDNGRRASDFSMGNMYATYNNNINGNSGYDNKKRELDQEEETNTVEQKKTKLESSEEAFQEEDPSLETNKESIDERITAA